MKWRPRFLDRSPAGYTPLVKADTGHAGPLGDAKADLGGSVDQSGPPGTLERLAAMQARAANHLPLRREDDADWPTEEDEMAANQARAKEHENNQRERRRLGMELLQQWGKDLPAQEACDKLRARDIEVTLATVYGWRSLLFGKGAKAETNGHTQPPVERKDPPHESPPAPRVGTGDVPLEPVGLDHDGKFKPIDQLSYKPAGGWDSLGLGELIDLLQSVQRLGGVAVALRKLKLIEQLAE